MIRTGGPAFPFEFHNQTSRRQESFSQAGEDLIPGAAEQYGGLTKRELFAAMAMQGMLANNESGYEFTGCAEDAIKYADALITELEKPS